MYFKKEHKTQLIEELQNIKNLNITESIINKIIEIYNKIYEKYKKNQKLQCPLLFTKLSKGQFKFRTTVFGFKNKSKIFNSCNNKYKKKQGFNVKSIEI